MTSLSEHTVAEPTKYWFLPIFFFFWFIKQRIFIFKVGLFLKCIHFKRRQLRESRFFQNCGTSCFDLNWKYHISERIEIRATVILKWMDFTSKISSSVLSSFYVKNIRFKEQVVFLHLSITSIVEIFSFVNSYSSEFNTNQINNNKKKFDCIHIFFSFFF